MRNSSFSHSELSSVYKLFQIAREWMVAPPSEINMNVLAAVRLHYRNIALGGATSSRSGTVHCNQQKTILSPSFLINF